jgi:multidrug efflux pump subunit AcrA (membrane-fusion protein)
MKILTIGSFLLLLAGCSQVETTRPQKKDLIDAVFATGKVISEQEYQVTAKTEDYLVQRFVDEGSQVASGMPLFQLSSDVPSENLSTAQAKYQDALRKLNANSPERTQLELQITQARSQLALDEKNHDRFKKLVELQAVSQSDFEKARHQYERSLANLQLKEEALSDFIHALELNAMQAQSQFMIQQATVEDYYLTSNLDGVVLKVYKQAGELVRRGETVALIGSGKKLAKLYVAEEDIENITIGQPVYLNLNTRKDQNFEGMISKIYPSFDEVEQSFVVEATFVHAPPTIYHNTQLQANIIIDRREGVLVIPAAFIGRGDSVMVEGEGMRYVKLGVRNQQWAEVVSGLKEHQVLQKPPQP